MEKYVMGLDAGATKSHLALFDLESNRVDFREWGPLNHEVLPGSFEQLASELGAFIQEMLGENALAMEQIAYSVFGMAGVDTREQHRRISEILRHLGLGDFLLKNDAFLGIPAACPDGVGICAINGTGCTIAGIDAKGREMQIGGIGALSDDRGGGGAMGTRVVAAVYDSFYRKGEATLLASLLFEELGIADKEDFVETITSRIIEGTLPIRAYNRFLFLAAEQGDKVAIGILRDVALNYAHGMSCLISELEFPMEKPLYVVLAGSVFVKAESPLLVNALKEMVAAQNPGYDLHFVLMQEPPVAGAVVWAMRELGAEGASMAKIGSQL